MNPVNRSDSASTTSHLPVCPECQSSSVTTTAKYPDADTYWRCERCGEIWNVGRRDSGPNGAVPWR
jgi:predicted Zn finger-like uncharacterized protein